MNRRTRLAAAAALLAFAPLALFADSFDFKGQTVEFENAEHFEGADAQTGQPVHFLVFRQNGWFKPSKTARGRALVVGGGGAGGYGTTAATNPGGGGGGGQVIDQEDLAYIVEKHTVTVGAGGAQKTSAGNGENGNPSKVAAGETVLASALGGGGGGSKSNGSGGDSVGTGGGGSGLISRGVFGQGGVGALGADYKGGNATVADRAAGGGGTGGAGNNSTSAKGGDGGAGYTLNIEIWAPEILGVQTAYGGGGGGGQSANTTASGAGSGKNGGGNGGYSGTAGADATPFSGGGGGGGGAGTAANLAPCKSGAGASGIVIIRFEDIEVTIDWVEIPVSAGGHTGKIFVDKNASWTRVNPSDLSSDIIIAYSNITARGGLAFFNPTNDTEDLPPVWATARVLAVGGGGGGGCVNTQNRGGGAGGGAGGFVEQDNLIFDNNFKFSIEVGAGGVGGAANDEVGKAGGKSSVTKTARDDETQVVKVIDDALGGGGGGARSAGGDGGSGGGSSWMTNLDKPDGGKGTEGQGYNGGKGQGAFVGGGGGGAGGKGDDTTDELPGAGGIGKKSDITGSDVWYAGGGGGASVNAAREKNWYLGAEGGKGGGGHGAGAKGGKTSTTTDVDPDPATSGADGLGGGGGGGTTHEGGTSPAGNGGSGVVIIRLSGFVVRAVPVPKATNYTFDGNAHTGVVSFYAYDLTGPQVATNADWYDVIAKINPRFPFEWDDSEGGQGERLIRWHIAQKRVSVPNVTSQFVFNNKEQYAVDRIFYRIDGNDYCHMDDEKTGVNLRYCHVDEYHSTTAGTYVAVLSLAKIDALGNFATNFIWRLSDGSDTMADQLRPWKIKQAPNAIVGFTFPDTQLSNMQHPRNRYSCDWGKDTAIYEYRAENDPDGWIPWGEGPSVKSNYVVRVTIPETPNWQGDVEERTFGLWIRLSDLYTDQLEITVSGYAQGSTALNNFPVPVRLREPKRDGFEVYSGFEYLRAGATGREMHFFTSAGVPVEHEVDTWNTSGDSLVWVRVPELKNTSTKLVLCWNRIGDIHVPAYDGAAVWRQYAGVWHMSQVERSQVPDATGNGRDAYFAKGADYEIEASAGPAGRSVWLKSGYLLVENDLFPAGTISNRLTYSGWYQNPGFVADGKIEKGNQIFAGLKYDATSTAAAKTNPGWALRMNNGTTKVMWEFSGVEQNRDNLNNLQTTWSMIGVQVGCTAVGDGRRGTGSKQFYTTSGRTDGSLTINSSSGTATHHATGVDKPLQLAATGFKVDEVRISTNILSETWLKEENNSVVRRENYCTYGLVRRDCDRYNDGKGLICDWWSTVPRLSKTMWKKGESGATLTKGAYKSGASVLADYVNRTNGVSLGVMQPTEVGYYSVVLDHIVADRGLYRPLNYSIDFYIIEPTVPQRDIGGRGGDSGRVLLMNADTRQVDGQDCAVTNQGWCATDPESGVTWWDRMDDTPGTNNILPGIQAVLRRASDGARLWHYANARHGNTFPTNDAQLLTSAQCYLPASGATALSVTNEAQAATRATTGWLMLRNVEDAALYSPCYTNGIGTIYFDAINSRKLSSLTAANANGYALVVEVATETTEGLPPLDENCWQEIAAGKTNWYEKLEGMWKPLTVCPAHFTGASPTDGAETQELALQETTGGYLNRFYRIHVPVLEQLGVAAHLPVRFRIRRTRVDEMCIDPETGSRAEDDAFILLDNVIVSPPTLTAELRPFGRFDESYDGRTAVGYGGAFATAFPSWTADSHSLTGRCTVALPPNSGVEGKNPDEYISMAQLFYRWRYLNQVRKPPFDSGSDWNMVILRGTEGGAMATEDALDIPAESGDVEFKFVSVMGRGAPYYQFVDYTGGFPKVNAAGYSEEQPLCESGRKSTKVLPSGGTDWYVRLRDGRSSYEGMRLYAEDADGLALTNGFELTADQQWTARLLVRDFRKGTIRYRLEGLNPQVDGAADYRLLTNRWHAATTVMQLPMTVDVKSGVADDWATIVCDGATDYLLFQLDEKKMRLQIAHAEFQAFDRWASAINADGLYVGSSVDTNTTSALTAEYDLWKKGGDDWAASTSHDDAWQEDFSVTTGELASVVYPRNQPFSTAVTRKNWQVQNAMWTYAKWSRQNNSDPTKSFGDDSAVQLEGRGKGSLSFVSAAKAPNGLDTVTYTARVAQYNEFTDFTYFNGILISDDATLPIQQRIKPATFLKNTTVVTQLALTELGADSYDGDGSVSIVNYYTPAVGGYEFRISRGTNDKDLRLALYRWKASPGGGMTCTPLCKAGSKTVNWYDYNADGKNAERGIDRLVKASKTPLGCAFLSVSEESGKTVVRAGVCEKDYSTELGPKSSGGQQFTCISYRDASGDRLTSGTFGMLACNCPGVFVKPTCSLQSVSLSNFPNKDGELQSGVDKVVNFTGNWIDAQVDVKDVANNWVVPGRSVTLTGHDGCWGFQAAAVKPQKVVVCVAKNGSGDWKEVYTNEVASFRDVPSVNTIRDSRICDVRLQVLGTQQDARTDVVINDVEMTQWNGQWTPHYKDGVYPYYYLKDGFVCTSGWVTEEASGEKGVLLQPTRATYKDNGVDPNPVSIRSPFMRGLGLVHFAWRNADSRAKLKVQVNEIATQLNVVQLTESIAEGEQAASSWETVATFDLENRPSGAVTVPINRRYHGQENGLDYYYGMVRVIVDREVEERAMSNQRARNDPTYGQVEILEMYTWDLPEYDKHSWAGWNFRAAGWDGSAADEFANLTDGLRGLSGILNNTLDPATLASREKSHYSARPPSVQSPVFRTNCVAAISFKARLYDERDLADSGHPAVVTVYGTRSLDAEGEPVEGSWQEAFDVEVTNRTYAPYLVKLKANDGFLAVRLGVKGVKDVVGEGGKAKYEPPLRVAIDDICLWERSTSAVAFRGARVRPFRDAEAIKATGAVMDIEDISEQPLASESFGFQGELVIQDEEEIITDDPNYPITVELWYYAPKPGDPKDWGFENWKTNPAAVRVALPPATGTNLVFRSMVDVSKTLCPPQFLEEGEPYRLVQYHLVAHYYFQDHQEGTHDLLREEWVMPEWYLGFPDPNAGKSFSAFTLVERLAPRRAWINEVNFCEPSVAASRAGQWVEIAVPSGEDMTGWKLDVYDYEGNLVSALGTFGELGWPAKKDYTGNSEIAAKSHYAFYTVKAPYTVLDKPKYDAVWRSFNGNGVLEYNRPYAFTLTRPTGIVEHRVVVQGKNEAIGKYWYWGRYEGTNLVEVMREKAGGTWTWAAEDFKESANAMVGVVTNQGALHADWVSPLEISPGEINLGQYIDPNWLIRPNGGYVWIYSNVLGDHLRQVIGGVTNTVGSLTVQEGTSTNILYIADRWYQLDSCEVDPPERTQLVGPVAGRDGQRIWTLNLNSVSNRLDVIAKSGVDRRVAEFGATPDNPYTPAIMKWLERGVTGGADGRAHPFKNPDGPLVPMHYRGTDGTSHDELRFPDMYWLDVDPTEGGWEFWGGMGDRPGSPGTLGQVDCPTNRVRILADGSTFVHTNHLTTVWLELLNTNSLVSYPPYRIQGLGNEQSDLYTGVWTSGNFKVTMRLVNGKVDEVFQPMRHFVFDWNSFRPADDPVSPYAARIEIVDPFSDQSPAAEWGWKKYSGCNVFTGWALDGRITPGGVSTLKKNDLLEF